ncbi:conidial pigment biosynthesis 1,3,6,8-tetrahydroxynaphthalene reductase Arp2 [Phyllosticta citrichinensis]
MTAAANLPDFNNIFSLEGKTAVVTGASRGLGLAAASGILQAGASKVYITSRSAKGCEEACDALAKVPNKRPDAKIISVPADSSTVEGIQQLIDAIAKTTDHVDILLLNAGVIFGGSIDSYPEEKWDPVLGLNLKSIFFSVQKFLPLLTKKATAADPSRILVTASIGGVGVTLTGEEGTIPYCVAKAGAIHLVKQLAVDLGPRNILTNAISPGFFYTELAADMIERLGGEDALGKNKPNGRLGKPEDFAATVVFLASRAGSHITGQNLVLDGGSTVGTVQR